ncbi:MAG: polysaccharide export outer membrane protein [Candidatus Electronema aureum]|uniref:Polysaccharide export outer membrane protein n=1 Tax=Candidatus Electronema aureum TaxID=2005002 RepID=A0A521G0P2_9BACT|nr:MAG: polysaccharide export outer membrane protein [Candidatus Electronema aureum]
METYFSSSVDLKIARLLNTVFVLLLCYFSLPILPAIAEDYQIGSGDVLSITVYGYDELKTKVRVSETGTIEFPLIGTVQLGGIKTSAASRKIEEMLSEGYIVKPQVQIYIEEFKSKKVAALGPFNKPGLIELSGPTTLLELISKAGGLQKDAGETITVTREEVGGGQKNITIEVKKLIDEGDAASNIPILGGETIAVAKGEPPVCYLTGQVKKPGAYPWTKNSNVLKMVSLAGGFTGMAAESRIKLVRVTNGKKQVMEEVGMDTLVQPDDVIEVPESFF